MTSSQYAYVTEILVPGGWHQPNTLYHRYRDALAAANSSARDRMVRAVRIRPVKILGEPAYSREVTHGRG